MDFFKCTVRQYLDDDRMLRLGPECSRIRLRSFDLNFQAAFGDSVITLVGCCLGLKTVYISDQAFTWTADHMAIRSKVPAREHDLQFLNRGIELLDQGAKLVVVDNRNSSP